MIVQKTMTVKKAVKEAARTQSPTVLTAVFIVLAYISGVWTGGSVNPGYYCGIYDHLSKPIDPP